MLCNSGRKEIRIIVKPEEVSDEISAQISRNLAKR